MTVRSNALLVAAPLTVLALAGGIAAGVGVALQPTAPAGEVGFFSFEPIGTAPAGPVTVPPCPSPPIAAEPTSGTADERSAWVAVALDALADRVQCTDDSDASRDYPWGNRPEYANYTGIELDQAGRRLVVHWKGPVPKVVRQRVGTVPAGLRVVFDDKAPYTSDQIDQAVALLTPGDTLVALPAIPGRAAGAPAIVLTGVVAREDGRAVEVGYAYADGALPPASDVTPAQVAAQLEDITGGLTVVAIPTPLLEP